MLSVAEVAAPTVDDVRARLASSAIWSYVATLVRTMPGRSALTLALMVTLGLLEGVGLVLLVPLLGLVGLDVQQGAMDRIGGGVAAVLATTGLRLTLPTVLALYVLIASVHALLHRCCSELASSLQQRFVASLRERLHRAIAATTWPFFAASRSSTFMHVLTAEIDRVGAATHYLLSSVATSIVVAVYLLLTLRLSAAMTALVLGCGTGLALLLKGKVRAARASGEELSTAFNDLYGAVTEHLGGMKTAKSYGAGDRHADVFDGLSERVFETCIGAQRHSAVARSWFEIGSVLILCFILLVSIEMLTMPPTEILLLLFLFYRMMPRFSAIQQSYQHFINSAPAFRSVMETQAQCEAAAEPSIERHESIELRHVMRFEKVAFGYGGSGGTPVIKDLDLVVRNRSTTAIVGPSGAGKSTIGDLMIGLISPDRGRILVDDTPLSAERLHAWREQIAYVAQDTFLFHDTVRTNLLWADPKADDERISRALRMAAAEEFVRALPDGLETVVGDRGVRLSGGERQRLALARALIRQPTLLVLDEAASSLDPENERRIEQAIRALHARMTIVVITHRLSSVRAADAIHVVEDGRIVESGTWHDLIEKENGHFRALCILQGLRPSADQVGASLAAT